MIGLEHLPEGDWATAVRNFEALRQLVPDSGGLSVGFRFGTDAVTFTASTTSATSVVTHGLGRTPVAVFMQEGSGFLRYVPSVLTATTFTAQGYVTMNTATTGTFDFLWLAIG